MSRVQALLLMALALVPRAGWSQGEPLGAEFRVNTYTLAYQWQSSVASDSAGNFVVVWESDYEDGSNYGIFGQRYASSGAPLGPEFRVNTYTTTFQRRPSVASDSTGNFVVVWQSYHPQDGWSFGIFGQRYAASGTPLGAEFRVNTYTTAAQFSPSVASDSSGNFIVIWESDIQDGSYLGVFGQRYASSGVPLGLEFRVNTYTPGPQRDSTVAADPSGNFVVIWDSYGQDGSSYGAFGQRYASSGNPLGPEFRVNTYTTGGQGGASVASDSSGNFVVIFDSQDGDNGGVVGQRYASSGAPLGPEFRVNTYTTGIQARPSAVSDSTGNFVVVWDSSSQDGSGYGVFGQRLASSGTPVGPEFRVNTYTTNSQQLPSLATDASGNFVVVWSNFTPNVFGFDLFGQRFGAIVPVELTGFRVE